MQTSVFSTLQRTLIILTAQIVRRCVSRCGRSEGPGTYEDLTYNSFIVINNTLAIVGGVAPHSPPNNILGVQSSNGTPSVTVATPYKTFSLESFWFGCDADLQQGSVNVAKQCTLTVAAFQKANDQEIATASYTFTPPENPVTQPPMVQAVLPNEFEGASMVTFIQSDSTLTGFGIDNMAYTAST